MSSTRARQLTPGRGCSTGRRVRPMVAAAALMVFALLCAACSASGSSGAESHAGSSSTVQNATPAALSGQGIVECVPGDVTADGSSIRVIVLSPSGATLLTRTFAHQSFCPNTRTAFNSDSSRLAGVGPAGDGPVSELGWYGTSGSFHALTVPAAPVVDRVTTAFAPGTDTLWWAYYPDGSGPGTIGRDSHVVTSSSPAWDTYSSGRNFDLVFPSGAGTPLAEDSSGQAENIDTGDIEINDQFHTLHDDDLRCQHTSGVLRGAAMSMPGGGAVPEPVFVSSDCTQLVYMDETNTLWVAPTGSMDPIEPRRIGSAPAGAKIISFTALGPTR